MGMQCKLCSSMKGMTTEAAGREAWPDHRPKAKCTWPLPFSEQRGAHVGRGGQRVGRGQQRGAHLCGGVGGHVCAWCARPLPAVGSQGPGLHSVSEGFGVFVFVCQHLKMGSTSHQN